MIPRSREILKKLEGGGELTKMIEIDVVERYFRFNDGSEPLCIYLRDGDTCEETENGFFIVRDGEHIDIYRTNLCWQSYRTIKMKVQEPAYIPPAATSGTSV